MTKRLSAKYKADRRYGQNLWGRPKSPVNKRSYGPGQHGQRRKSKVSDFGIQLRAKQKLKGYYGDLTEKQIAARSALYLNSTVNAYERGRAASFGLTLPVYPADGGTSCMSNCRCRWDITETSTEYRATWTLNTSAEHCDDCEARATKYSPYTVKKG